MNEFDKRGEQMAKKKSRGIFESIEEVVGDVIDAGSVAATGSQLGVLELAAEDELSPARSRRKHKAKTAPKKKPVKAVKKAKTKAKKKTATKKNKKKAKRKTR